MWRRLALFTVCTILLQLCMPCSHGYDDQQAVKVDIDGQKQIIRLVTNSEKEEEEGDKDNSVGGGHSLPKVNISRSLFFKIEELRVGNKIPLFFPRMERPPRFISNEMAESIPFSSKRFKEVVRFFSIPPGSSSADAMRDTLELCEAPHMQGETKLCATSKESLFGFVRRVFGGGDGGFDVLWTTHLTHQRREEAQNYDVLSFKEYTVPSAVGCHIMPYPYAVYFCHHFEGGAKLFMTQLQGEDDGERVEAAVLCHMDTSTWGPDIYAFKVMGTKPGTPACHSFPQYDLVFIHQGN